MLKKETEKTCELTKQEYESKISIFKSDYERKFTDIEFTNEKKLAISKKMIDGLQLKLKSEEENY